MGALIHPGGCAPRKELALWLWWWPIWCVGAAQQHGRLGMAGG